LVFCLTSGKPDPRKETYTHGENNTDEARIIVMTTFEGEDPVQRALQAGARSYIRKNMPPREIADAIRQVHAGKKRAPAEVAANLAGPLPVRGGSVQSRNLNPDL